MTVRCVLAFDFGLNNIGVAAGQAITCTAEGIATLKAKNGVPHWSAIDELVTSWRPDILLVGLPLNMDQTISAMAERARQFALQLAERYTQPVELVDERLTSFEARGRSADRDARHAIAAQLIAETYLSHSDQRR